MGASLTCTGAGCEAHSLPSSVKDHVEALHDSSTNHQCVGGRRDAEPVTFIIQASPHHGLNVKLLKRKEQEREREEEEVLAVLATSPKQEGSHNRA